MDWLAQVGMTGEHVYNPNFDLHMVAEKLNGFSNTL